MPRAAMPRRSLHRCTNTSCFTAAESRCTHLDVIVRTPWKRTYPYFTHLDVVVCKGGLDAEGGHAEALVPRPQLDGLLQQADDRLALAAGAALHRPEPRVRLAGQKPLLAHQPHVLLPLLLLEQLSG